MKKALLLLIALVMMLTSVGAYAATAISASAGATVSDELAEVKSFKFEHKKTGIGRGTCPVYTAPYTNAYRCANGKASCDTNSYVDVGGFSEQGWLLVRYTTNSGSTRTGWIPPKYVKDFYTVMTPHFSYVQQFAPDQLYVTDNCLDPHDESSYFAVLDAGEEFYVIGRYNYYEYDLWYIEFTVDGKPARGFIEVSDLQ